jgi:hypothetical protein
VSFFKSSKQGRHTQQRSNSNPSLFLSFVATPECGILSPGAAHWGSAIYDAYGFYTNYNGAVAPGLERTKNSDARRG